MAEPIRWQDAWWHQQPDGSWLRFNEQTQEWEAMPMQPQPAYQQSAGMSSGGKWALGIGIAVGLVFILMVLAAIAIPVFLRQREKGFISQAELALKNAATAEERHLMNNGTYTDSVAELEAAGYEPTPNVDISVPRVGDTSYCIEAHHEMLDDVYSYFSGSGQPREGPCV